LIDDADPDRPEREYGGGGPDRCLVVLEPSQPTAHNTHRTSETTRPQHESPVSDTMPLLAASHPSDLSLSEAVREAQPTPVDEGPAASPVRARARRPTTRPIRTAGRVERTADVVARLRAERPQASLAELALAAGVSERHVRRLVLPATPGRRNNEQLVLDGDAAANLRQAEAGHRVRSRQGRWLQRLAARLQPPRGDGVHTAVGAGRRRQETALG